MTTPPLRSRNTAGRTAFFAHKAKIDEMLKGGILMLDIHAQLQLPGSYRQFCRLCEQELGRVRKRRPGAREDQPSTPIAPPPQPRPGVAVKPLALRDPIRTQASTPRRRWDPASIDEAELLKPRIEE